MTDDLNNQEFRAPYTRATPAAVKLAGRRLLAYAAEHQARHDVGLLELEIPDSEWQAVRDQRLIAWFAALSS